VNGFHHLPSAPYHPISNGLAELAVQIVKKGLKKKCCGTFCSAFYVLYFHIGIPLKVWHLYHHQNSC